MPIYKAKNGKTYDIPEDRIVDFENMYPDSTVEIYDGEGRVYDIPLDKREKFQKKFNGWSYDGKKKDDLAAKDSLISEGLKDLDNEAKQLGVAKVASIAGVNGATERVVADTISKTKTEKDDVVSKVPELGGGWNATEQEKKQLLAGMQASKVRLANTVDDFNKGVDNLIDYGKKSRATLSNGVVDAGVRVNADTGRAEKMYMSPDGKRFADKEMAEYATKLFKRSADVSVAGQLRRAKERLSYLQSLRSGRGDELDTKQGLGEKIGTSVLSSAGGVTGVVGGLLKANVGRRLADNEWARLNTAINETEEQIRVLEGEYKRLNGDEDNFVESLGKTLIAPRTWAFGVPELMDSAVKLSSDNSNSDREEKATMLLMESTLGKEEAHRLYDKNMSNWRKWGAITGQAVPFMLDFALTSGVTSGIRAGAKTAGKVATKVVGKEVAEQIAKNGIKAYAKSNGVKGALQAGTDWTIKAFGATADEFARGFVVANTVQGAKTASDAIDRKLGGVVVGEDGGLKFANDKSWGDAIWQAEANATIENMSEMAGGRLDKLIPNLPKTKVVSKIADVFGLKRISNVINGANYAALKNVSNMMRGAFAKMGIHDITGEISEEYYGQLWRTAFALDDAYAYDENGNKVNLLKTGEFHKDIWGGMSLTVGVMKAVQGGATGAQYMSIKHGVNKADKRASTLLGADTWGTMRFQFENATNEQMGDLVEAVLKDKKLNDDERGAVMDYATNYMVLRGANTATYKQVDAEAVTKDIQEVQEAYNNGRGIKSDEEMQNVNSVYRMLQGRIDSELGAGVADEIEADPQSVLHRYKGTDKEDLVRDYITSKSVYDGIIDRVQEDIELKNVEAEAKVDARTNKSNGLVQSVKLSSRDSDGNDRIVYVKDGNLVIGDDGQIDREKSDSAFVVFDEVSGKSEMMSLSDFIGVNEVLNADEAKRVATESITNEYAQLMANRIDGVLSFNAGEIYKGIDDNGSEVVVEVVGDNGDGTVNAIVGNDNKTVTVKKEDVQRWSNNVIAERVKRFDEEGKNDNRFFGFGLNNGKYRLDDKVQLRRNNELVEGRIVSAKNEDGMYQVEIGDPLEGGRVVLLSEQEIEGMNDSNSQNGVTKVETKVEELAQQEGNDPVVKKEDIPATEGGVTALERIPKSELGEPMYEQVDAEIAWGAIVEQTEGDVELAMEVVKGMIANKEERLKKVEKTKPKVGETVTQKIKALKEHKAIIEKARYDVEAWKNIGAVLARKTAEAEREKSVAEETLQPNGIAGQEVRQDVVVPQEEVVTSAEAEVVNTEKEQTEVARQVESGNDDVQKEQSQLMDSGVDSGVSLSQAEIDELLDKMEKGATERPKIELNPKSWNEQFGNNGIVSTPIGDVKMGENQIAKLFEKGRSEQFGMIKPTLETPQIVVEVPSQDAKGNTERASSYLFVKTFIDDKGAKVYYFKSVTVKKDGLEVSVSSHLDRQKRVLESLKKGKLLYRFDGGAQTEHLPADVSVTTSHEVMQGNYDNKVSESSDNEQTLQEKIDEAEKQTNTNPTDAQKKAGNYKKGRVNVGSFEIVIEQPKGSVRSGVDGNGNKWSTVMNNTYGYFAETKGVDGDNIDVFLTNDVDYWDGRRIYVVDQYNEDGSFDEHKVMLGYNDEIDAKADYLKNYDEDWEKKHKIVVSSVNVSEFEKWLASSNRKTKPFAEYKNVGKENINDSNKGEQITAKTESEDNILYRRGDEDVSSYDNELKQIKSEAIANGNFMLAPNGKPTRLNERQWLQVRTKAFKDWFGDWELRHKAVNVVRASKKFKDFSSAKSWANKNIAKVYSNEETGGKGNIEISKTSISKYFNSSSVEKSSNAEVHKSVVSVLPDIIKHSVVGEIHPDYIKVDGVRAKKNGIAPNSEIHRLYGAVEMEGNVYRVKTTVKYFTDDNINNKAHTYEVIKIELLNEFSSSELEQDSQTVSPIQTTNLLQGVEKTYEKGKYILDDYSKVVDDNGEPLVVYHGTKDRFNTFSTKKTSTPMFYFTSERHKIEEGSVGARTSGRIMEVYLNMRNPAGWREEDNLTNDQIRYKGHDGKALLDDDYNVYVVFSPNQIKSATDNIGSFDDADEDIRFRIGDIKSIGRNGRKIEFTKVNPTVTMNALAKWLDKSKVEHSYRTARTGSRYISFEREGVTFSVRGANHTSDGTFSGYNEGIDVSVDESTGKVYDVEVDLSVNDYGIDDLRTIISDIVAYNDGSKSVEDLHEDVAVYFEDRNKGLNIDEATLRKRREDYNADLKQFYDGNREELKSINDRIWKLSKKIRKNDASAEEKEEFDKLKKRREEIDEAESDYRLSAREKYFSEDEISSGRYLFRDKDNEPKSVSVRQRVGFALRERGRMRDKVAELTERLGLDNVEVVTDGELLSGEKKKAKGFYDKKDGKITIVLSNHRSVADIEATLLHEAVAHYGLRKLFGDDFNKLLRDVYEKADKSVRNEIVDLAGKKYGWNFEIATEEYLASLAENTKFEGVPNDWWSTIKRLFMDLLSKFGFEFRISDNDLRYILWKSYDNLNGGGKKVDVFSEAENIAKEIELSVGNYAEPKSEVVYNDMRIKNSMAKVESDIDGKLAVSALPLSTELPIVEVESEDVSFDEAKQAIRDLPKEVMTLDGYVLNISKKSRMKLSNNLMQFGGNSEYIYSLLNLEEVVNNSVLIEEHRDRIKIDGERKTENVGDENIDKVQRFYGAISIDGMFYRAKTTAIVPLREDTRLHNYEITNIELIVQDGNSVGVNKKEVAPPNSTTANESSTAKLNATSNENVAPPISTPTHKEQIVALNASISLAKLLKDVDFSYERGRKITDEMKNSADSEVDGVLYRQGSAEEYERVQVREQYERRVKNGLYQSREAIQDSMLSLKVFMEETLKAKGEKKHIEEIEDHMNPYLGENRLSSVNKAEADAFSQSLVKPMLDEVSKLARNDAERGELIDYMMAKHGLERNVKMAESDAIKANANEPSKTVDEYLGEYRKKDYAGLTTLTEYDSVVDAEMEAKRMVDEYENMHDTVPLWSRINDVSKATLLKLYETGMINEDTYKNISDMYEYYIPLRGFDETTSSEEYAYLPTDKRSFNAPIKKAMGRKSKADDPFAYLVNMADNAIIQGNRNVLVKQKILNFVLNNPSDLISVSSIWLEYDDVNEEWVSVFPDNIDANDSANEVERKMREFEDKMSALAKNNPDKYRRSSDNENIPYRVVNNQDLHQHQVLVKRNGREYVLTVNGSPRLAQALNGQTNPDNDKSNAIGAILQAGEYVNRQLSAFYTTRNPDFVVSNFIRDMLYSNTMVWIKESADYALKFNRNTALLTPIKMKTLFEKMRKGTLNMNDKIESAFYHFVMNGGETGYVNIRDIEQHKSEIQKELKRAKGKISVSRAWELLSERFDELNRSVENCARFSAFLTSREFGRSIGRSIYDAKEISVNFNKKGSGAKFLGKKGQTKLGNISAFTSGIGRSGFVFWNAAVQGTANFANQAKRHPFKASGAVASMFILGALTSYLGGIDDDDDKNSYYNLPEHVRRSNVLFRVGDHWISIPLPVEYRAVYGMGELASSVLNGKEHFTDGEIAQAIAGQVTQVLPIDFLDGKGGVGNLVPSAVKPIVEAYVVEESWVGMPLYKDTPYNKNMPEWTKAFKRANKYIVGLSSALNEATGGDEYTKGKVDINPAKIEYALSGYFSGVFNTIDKMTKTAETLLGEREYNPRNVLLLNRIVKAGDESTEYRAINNEYFRLQKEHEIVKGRLKNYEKDTESGKKDYSKKIDEIVNSPAYERSIIFDNYSRSINEIYKILKDTYDDKERAYYESVLLEVKRDLIDEAHSTRTS